MAIGTPYQVGSQSTAASSNQAVIASAGPTTAGDAIIVSASTNGSSSPSSCTDSQGNTYRLDRSNANEFNSAVFVADPSNNAGTTAALNGTTDTITVTYSATTTNSKNANAIGCSGVSGTDVNPTPGFNASSNSPSLSSGVLSQSNELVIAAEDNGQSGNLISWSAPISGLSSAQNGTFQYSSLGAAVVSSTASVTASGTLSLATKWDVIIISLKGTTVSASEAPPMQRRVRRAIPEDRRRQGSTTGLPVAVQPPALPAAYRKPQKLPPPFMASRRAHHAATAFTVPVNPGTGIDKAVRRPQRYQPKPKRSAKTPPTGGVTASPAVGVRNVGIRNRRWRPFMRKKGAQQGHGPSFILAPWTCEQIFSKPVATAVTNYTVLTNGAAAPLRLGDWFQVFDPALGWQVWFNGNGSAASPQVDTGQIFSVTANQKYTAAMWMWIGATPWPAGVKLALKFHKADGTLLSQNESAAVTSQSPQFMIASGVAPANATKANIIVAADGTPPAAVDFFASASAQGPGALVIPETTNFVAENSAVIQQQYPKRSLSGGSQSSGTVWMGDAANTHTLNTIDPEVASWAFNKPNSFLISHSKTASPVQDGFAATAVLKYESYAQFQLDISNNAIKYPVRWLLYDPEAGVGWPTPVAEQNDPATFMQNFVTLAHAHGYKVILTPGRDLAFAPNPVHPRNTGETADHWYNRVGIATMAANTGAEVVEIQDQANTTSIVEQNPQPVFGCSVPFPGAMESDLGTMAACKIFNQGVPASWPGPGGPVPNGVTNPLVVIKISLTANAPYISASDQAKLAVFFASMPKTGKPIVSINQEGEAPRFGYTAAQVAGSHNTAYNIFKANAPANAVYAQDMQTYSPHALGGAFSNYVCCAANGQQDLPLYLGDWYPTTNTTSASASFDPLRTAILALVPKAVIGAAECNYTTGSGITYSSGQTKWFTDAWAYAQANNFYSFITYFYNPHGVNYPPDGGNSVVQELQLINTQSRAAAVITTSEFISFFTTAYGQAKAAAPSIQVWCGLSTNFGTPADQLTAMKSVPKADGFWYNMNGDITTTDEFFKLAEAGTSKLSTATPPQVPLLPVEDGTYQITALPSAFGFTNVTFTPNAPSQWPAGWLICQTGPPVVALPGPGGGGGGGGGPIPTPPVRLATAFVKQQMPRVYAQDILTGMWVNRDVPNISNMNIQQGLNGSGNLSFTIQPTHRSLGGPYNPSLQMWQTALYVEEGDAIKFGGIITAQSWQGSQWIVSANEFSSYANGFIFEGPYYKRLDIDATDVVRFIWDYIQKAQPNSNLHLVVDISKSGVLLGHQNTVSTTTSIDPKTHKKTTKTTKTPIPYILAWWDSTDLGQEIANIAQEVPFEWHEVHTWRNAQKLDVDHNLKFGIPRVGGRRDGLRFVEGENVIQPPVVAQDGSIFADDIWSLGAGQGANTIRAHAFDIHGHLRRQFVYTNQTVKTHARALTKARRIQAAKSKTDEITQVVVKRHPNAYFGGFGPGDDLLISVGSGWRKGLQIWSRILQTSQDPTTNQMTITCVRSDSFTYMAQSGSGGSE